jgi:hypothetical protein
MIQIIDNTDEIVRIFETEFACTPPDPKFGDIVAIVEDGEVKAFMSRELLMHVGTFWVNPTDRKTVKSGRWLKELAQYVIVNMPKHSTTIIIDETGLYDRILRFLGFRKSKGTPYTIDLNSI